MGDRCVLSCVTPRMSHPGLAEDQSRQLRHAARTVTGDELRSLTYFTRETVEQLYLRDDLDRSADLIGFADNERLGFRSQMVYHGTQLGDYQSTIRVFDHGYLTRVIVNDHGVWATTDAMQIGRFRDLASALSAVLRTI